MRIRVLVAAVVFCILFSSAGAGLLEEAFVSPSDSADIYFVSNPADKKVKANVQFRVQRVPQVWDPLTGETRALPQFNWDVETTSVPMTFVPHAQFHCRRRTLRMSPNE